MDDEQPIVEVIWQLGCIQVKSSKNFEVGELVYWDHKTGELVSKKEAENLSEEDVSPAGAIQSVVGDGIFDLRQGDWEEAEPEDDIDGQIAGIRREIEELEDEIDYLEVSRTSQS